jgi:hypothetical protein
MVGDSFLYMLYFQWPGIADAELDADPSRTLRRMISFDLQSLTAPDVTIRMIAPGLIADPTAPDAPHRHRRQTPPQNPRRNNPPIEPPASRHHLPPHP